jgi:SAM-dependent methyltransferase
MTGSVNRMPDLIRPAEPEDVVMCYRLILQREPDGDDAIQGHLIEGPSLWDLIKRFIESRECELNRIDQGCLAIWRRQDGRAVDIEASPEARAEILAHVENVWSAYGTEDPFWSVHVNPAYRADHITPELTEQFYESGAADAANLKLAFERNRIEIDPQWHILELGCGLGRIGEHFCREFNHYYGIDISANHIAHALKRFSGKNIKNAKFYLLREAFDHNLQFDVFYSLVVLQHNPPPVIYYLLDRFLEKLKVGGFAFFQLPCFLDEYSFSVEEYLAGHGKRDAIEMHALPQKYVFELLYRHGLQPIEIWPFPVIGPIGVSYAFFARKNTAA